MQEIAPSTGGTAVVAKHLETGGARARALALRRHLLLNRVFGKKRLSVPQGPPGRKASLQLIPCGTAERFNVADALIPTQNINRWELGLSGNFSCFNAFKATRFTGRLRAINCGRENAVNPRRRACGFLTETLGPMLPKVVCLRWEVARSLC